MLILPGFGEALPETPHGRLVRDGFRVPEEPSEAYPVRGLPLQLGVAEPVLGLQHQQLHHHRLVGVGSASPGGVVGVHGFNDEPESFPVDLFLCLGESIAVLLYVLVGLSEHVGPEGVHAYWLVTVIYKFNRGGVSKTRG